MPEMFAENVEPSATRFLADHPDVVLFCRDEQGSPIGYPMRTAAMRGSMMYFTTYRKSAKVRHLERDALVSVLCFIQDGPRRVEWVEAAGKATVWSPSPEEVNDLICGRDDRVPAAMLDHVRRRLVDGKRIMVRVDVERAQRCSGTIVAA